MALAVGALAIAGRGVYGVMLTFALNEMAYYAAFQWRDVTGGDNGLRGLPRPDVLGVSLDDPTRYYYFTALVVLLAFAAVLRLVDSPFGAVLRGIRENEARARAIGYRVRRFKLAVFAVSGALSGLAGGLYAELYRFVPLQAIDLDTSTAIVVATLLGGTGSPYGPLLGAAIYTVLSELAGPRLGALAAALRGGVLRGRAVLARRAVEPGGALEPPCCARVASASASAPTRRSTAWTSTCGAARCTRSSAPTAPARPPSSTCSAARLRPSGGTIELAGRDVTRLDVTGRSHLGLGRSYQRTNVFPKLTAFENVRLAAQSRTRSSFALWRPASSLGGGERARRARAGRGRPARARRAARGELAGGDQRLLELAITLATDPVLLLLDEPTQGLSPRGRAAR